METDVIYFNMPLHALETCFCCPSIQEGSSGDMGGGDRGRRAHAT